MPERRNSATNPELLAAALFDVAAESGLDNASVREVAKSAGVSIGAVQHHFSTKDEMLAFALRTLVDRLLTRLPDAGSGTGPHRELFDALSQLLPLDEQRGREVHVLSAFAVRAATNSALAEIRRTFLFTARTALSGALIGVGTPEAETRAALLLATVNGLALDAVSNPSMYPADYLTYALETQIRLTLHDADISRPSTDLVG
ncbi:TetR/AcrR family transcriptional regulator [Rhodococcus sp. 27YEA15]|uniref:TetR/AcrR family transcriptional regulator n=1 Tax=Rhodococcus sp. 27YEA15 TaxID=3156259 RepID=UPI003C7EC8DF